MKNKHGSINQIKDKGKSSAKQPAKSSSSKDTKSETKNLHCNECGVKECYGTENCNSNYCTICKRFFHKVEYCYLNKDGKNYQPDNKPKTEEKKTKLQWLTQSREVATQLPTASHPLFSRPKQRSTETSSLKLLPPNSPHRVSWWMSQASSS